MCRHIHYWKNLATTLFSIFLLITLPERTIASDHLDVFNADHDLIDFYAFKSPNNANKVVFIINLFRNANDTSRFSSTQEFSIALRPSQGTRFNGPIRFDVGNNEQRFVCSFNSALDNKAQNGQCSSPNGENLIVNVNDTNGVKGESFRVYAGLRADPFFMAAMKVLLNFTINSTNYPNPGSNDVDGQNVLSIVIEADINKTLGKLLNTPTKRLLAARAEVIDKEEKQRLDSIGRPELTNMIMGVPLFDAGQRFTLMGAPFSKENTFHTGRISEREQFRQRINVNLQRWDQMDEVTDWPLENDIHPLTELSYKDYLILDLNKPFSDEGYYEIERALINNKAHTTAGGRWLNEDVVDITLTTLISNNKKHYSDHLAAPSKPVSTVFPYLAAPY